MAGFARFGAGGKRRSDAVDEPRLPQGAEAALWSILEPLPDPRNHLALTRDLSGEVHITDLDRALALAARDRPAAAPATATEAGVAATETDAEPAVPATETIAEPAVPVTETAIVPVTEAAVDVREMVDPYYDLGTIAENPHLTDHLFTTAEG